MALIDDDELLADLAEVFNDFPTLADFLAVDGQSAIGVPISISDISADNGQSVSSYRDDLAATVVVPKSRLPFIPNAGTQITLQCGKRLRVTAISAAPFDVAYTLTVENKGKAAR